MRSWLNNAQNIAFLFCEQQLDASCRTVTLEAVPQSRYNKVVFLCAELKSIPIHNVEFVV